MIRQDEATSDHVYDKVADTYGRDSKETLPQRIKYELISHHLHQSDHVLDVGCANGLHLQRIAPLCRHIDGVDINERMLDIARRMIDESALENVELHRQSASELGFDNDHFDLVYAFSILLLVPDTIRAIEEIHRVLKPGGIAVLDITGRFNLSAVYWRRYYRRQGHFGLNAFSRGHIQRELNRIGFDIVEEHASGLTDQWRYIPGLHLLKSLARLFHGEGRRDLDYRISNLVPLRPLANRWYLVCRKR